MGDDMLSIGPFGAACGLSVRSLRHYDEVGLLRPALVDHSTGYRYYALSQLRDARAIRRLRDLDVPLGEIDAVLQADEQGARALLRAHRERMTAAAATAGWILTELDMIIDGREALVPTTEIELDLQDLPELRLAAVVRHLHDDEVPTELPRMLAAVESWLAERSAQPTEAPVAVFRSGDAPGWHLVEAGWPAPPTVQSDGAVGIHVYPASRTVGTHTTECTTSCRTSHRRSSQRLQSKVYDRHRQSVSFIRVSPARRADEPRADPAPASSIAPATR